MSRWVRICAMVLALAIVGSLAGCNTLRGIGKDIQAAGRAVEKAVS